MSIFRGEAPTLSQSTAVEMQNANTTTFPKIQVVETVQVALGATSATQLVWTSPPASTVANGQNAFGQYSLAGVTVRFGTASTSGTLQVEKTPSGTASGAGTNLLTGTVALSGTTNTNAFGTLVASPTTLQLAAGDSISLVIAGTMTNLANCVVSLYLVRTI